MPGRSRTLTAIAVAAIVAAAAGAPAARPQEPPAGGPPATQATPAPSQPSPSPDNAAAKLKSRMFRITMRYEFDPLDKRLQSMEFWFPLPIEDSVQQVYNRRFETAYDTEQFLAADTGNRTLHMKCGPRGGVPMRVNLSFDVERFEDLRHGMKPAAKPPSKEEEKALFERWLRAERLTPLDREVKSQASRVVSRKKAPIEKARAIYDHLVTKMTVLEDAKQSPGAGYGDVPLTLRQMKGNATDIAAVFVALCRAEGIPARTVLGFKLPESGYAIGLRAYHSWAEFYLQGVGWVPVDPAEAYRNVSRRDFYFGGLDENRVSFSVGRDIILLPPQQGEPLNYWIDGYWEGDGQPMPLPGFDIRYEHKAEIPNKIIPLVPAIKPTQPPSPKNKP